MKVDTLTTTQRLFKRPSYRKLANIERKAKELEWYQMWKSTTKEHSVTSYGKELR